MREGCRGGAGGIIRRWHERRGDRPRADHGCAGIRACAIAVTGMLPLPLAIPPGRPLSLLTIGAHPDDIEIGAGGTLLSLAAAQPGLRAHYAVLTGTPERHEEARNAAAAFLPATDLTIELHDLPEGRFPAAWDQVKDVLETVARTFSPDLIIAPSRHDAHQDHRIIGEIVPTVFRDPLFLAYEIPKWDGDLAGRRCTSRCRPAWRTARPNCCTSASRPSVTATGGTTKFPGAGPVARHGVPRPYAEAFHCAKVLIGPPG